MPDNIENLVEEILQRCDTATICFYQNGLESKGFYELNKILAVISSLYESLLQSGDHGDIVGGLTGLFTILNSSIELEDSVKISDLLNFELRPLLLRLSEDS